MLTRRSRQPCNRAQHLLPPKQPRDLAAALETIPTPRLQEPRNRGRQLPPPKQPRDLAAALELCCPAACSGTASVTATTSD